MTEPGQQAQDVARDLEGRVEEMRRTQEYADGPTGEGEALEGRVRVTISEGRVSEVALDPRALRTPSDELAEAFAQATNAALEQYAAEVTEGTPAVPSLEDLARVLDDVTTNAQQALDSAGEGVRQSLAQVQRASELHRRR